MEMSSSFERVELDAAPKLGEEVPETFILVSSLEEPDGLWGEMFSLSASFDVAVLSRTALVLFPIDVWVESSFCEWVVFDVKSSLAGSAVEGFRSLDELTDGVALAFAA